MRDDEAVEVVAVQGLLEFLLPGSIVHSCLNCNLFCRVWQTWVPRLCSSKPASSVADCISGAYGQHLGATGLCSAHHKKAGAFGSGFHNPGGRVGISGSVCGVVNPRVPGLPSQTAPSYWVPELRPAPILQTREGPRWNALGPRRPGRSSDCFPGRR